MSKVSGAIPVAKFKAEAGTVFVEFADGEVASYTMNPEHVLFDDVFDFGLKTKVRNQIAVTGGMKVDEAKSAIRELFDAFDNGEWSVRGKGEAAPSGGYLARAISELKGKPLEEVKTWLTSLSADEKERAKIHAALRADAAIQPIIARLKAEAEAKRPKAKVDTGSLLGTL